MSALPTVYDYYTKEGIESGLEAEGDSFTLNGREIEIRSGAVHYFRVHPELWRDRLKKLRACGLNCLETYFAWNLHEPEPNFYEFGKSGSDFEEFCDIQKYLEIAKEEDLLVIARPGPYICSEWEFGGLPSWLLKIDGVKVRTSDSKFIERVEKYFEKLFGILKRFQFQNGGSIIMFQIENEYGNVKENDKPIDISYLKKLKEIYNKNGIIELLCTSDTPTQGNFGTLPGVLYTANFQDNATKELNQLKKYQPNKPCLVMEFWTGWFDYWGGKHEKRSDQTISKVLTEILKYPASVNFYMFHGGTNWGFMNGGNFENSLSDNSNITLDTTSYDYDAPLRENGDYGEKYYSFKDIIEKNSKIKFKTPPIPDLIPRIAYEEIEVNQELNVRDLIQKLPKIASAKTKFMEFIDQNYGYVIYRKTDLKIDQNSVLKIKNHVKDTVMVLINGTLISPVFKDNSDLNKFGFWKLKDSALNLPETTNATLDIIIENFGRINYGKLYQFNQNKGLDEDQVLLNDKPIQNWEIYRLTYEKKWTNSLHNWMPISDYFGPKLYRATLNVNMDKKDTYMDMREWTKGIVIVNDFVLGRYFKIGPQQALYLPAPFLKNGENRICVFEHFRGSSKIKFCKEPIFNE